jgi:Na+-driven multidrug efflux pump
MALAGGLAPLIGQNYGANLSDRVNEAIKKGIKFAILYAIGCAILLALAAGTVANAFSDDAYITQFISYYLFFVPVSFIGLNLFLVVTSSMNATEKPKGALVLNIIRAFVIGLPLAYILTMQMGVEGFLLSIIITNILSGIAATFAMKTIRCKNNINVLT